MANPFLRLRARSVFLGFFALALALALGFGTLEMIALMPLAPEDPLLAPLLYILLFTGLSGAVLLRGRRSLRLRFLLGHWPADLSWGQLLGLLVGVFLFSLGAFQISYVLLSWVAPTLVESTLQQTLLLSAADTHQPQLYNALMLLSAIVVAPVTEEFLFRGILLHRWGTKWGIRWGIVLTSVLFGVLHSNLVGLFVFGLIMSLLYLRSRCLWVPVVAHGVNNAIASGLDWLTRDSAGLSADALAEFRASWWVGLLCLAVSAPFLWRYIHRNWPGPQAPLPYLQNQAVALAQAQDPPADA